MEAEAVTRQEKKTRGKVDGLDRVAWYYMKKQHGFTELQVAQLKGAVCPAKVKDSPATLLRIFDTAAAKEKGVTVEDYEILNDHPGLILYEGYYSGHGRAREIIIERRNEVGPSLLEKKIKEGDITEVGVIIDKTTTQKWLGRIGTFLMYGGFLLILVVVVGIVIAVSLLSKSC